MENNTYLISFNFSNSVYIGTTVFFQKRAKDHLRKINKLSDAILKETESIIEKDTSVYSHYPCKKGFHLKMYKDALIFYRNTNEPPKIKNIKKLNSFKCDCMSHDGTPCKKALLFEAKYINKHVDNYNRQKTKHQKK